MMYFLICGILPTTRQPKILKIRTYKGRNIPSEEFVDHAFFSFEGNCNLQVMMLRLCPVSCVYCRIITRPGTSRNSVIDIEMQQAYQFVCSIFRSIEQQSKASVNDFSPPYAAAVVQRHPGGPAE